MNELRFTCPGLTDGGRFPEAYTGRGEDRSPEILLENPAPGTRTLLVTLEDTSHPIRNFTHWVLWNYPASERIPGGLPKGGRLENGACQGLAYGFHRYAGPKPPPLTSHHYRLTVYTLDCVLEKGPWSRKQQILKASEGHILQKGVLTARFP